MPNGVSCAYFAVRNHIYGKSEKNIFKEGIAGAQTARTLDSVAQTAAAQKTVLGSAKGVLSKAAALARKIVYPLIIASGIYNTAKSDDKVKTGAEQATGIGTMYAFEQVAERTLKNLDKKILTSKLAQNKKFVKIGWYIAKGLTFVASSLGGYTVGSTAASALVDKARNKKMNNNIDEIKISTPKEKENIDTQLFEDIKLI